VKSGDLDGLAKTQRQLIACHQ